MPQLPDINDPSHPFHDEYMEMKKNPRAYMQKKRDSYRENHLQHLKANGFPDADKLTDKQIDLIFMPSDGPENFYCDGELDHKTALSIWKTNLSCSGLGNDQIKSAENIIFGK